MAVAITVAVLILHMVVYFITKFIARKTIKSGADITKPRVIALVAVIVSSVLLALWARSALINPALYDTLSPLDQGRYVGQVMGSFIFPTIISIVVILFRISRAVNRGTPKSEERGNRSSPKW